MVVRRGQAGTGSGWGGPGEISTSDPQTRRGAQESSWLPGVTTPIRWRGARGASGRVPTGAWRAHCREGRGRGAWTLRSASVCERQARLEAGVHASVRGLGHKRGDTHSRQPVSLLQKAVSLISHRSMATCCVPGAGSLQMLPRSGGGWPELSHGPVLSPGPFVGLLSPTPLSYGLGFSRPEREGTDRAEPRCGPGLAAARAFPWPGSRLS